MYFGVSLFSILVWAFGGPFILEMHAPLFQEIFLNYVFTDFLSSGFSVLTFWISVFVY